MTTPSRQELRRQRREKIEERQRRAELGTSRRMLRTRLRVGSRVGVAVLLFALGVVWAFREATAPLPGVPIPAEGAGHVDMGAAIGYASNPPSSGPHYPTTARWQFNNAEVAAGLWVHNLEHGGIVMLYKCPEDCAQLKSQLQGLYNTLPPSRFGHVKLVVAPSGEIEGQIVALAWNRRATYDGFDEGQLRHFYKAFVDRGPEPVP